MSKILLLCLSFLLINGCKSKEGTGQHDHSKTETTSSSEPESKKSEYYTCSMHPHVREDGPGKCPICEMNLTKIIIEEDDDDDESLQSKSKVSFQCKEFPDVTSEGPDTCPIDGSPMIEVELEDSPGKVVARVKLRKSQLSHFKPEVFSVTKMKMFKKLRVLGRVKSAEEKASNIAARFPARVEKVFIESVGSHIKKGDPVVKVYSPELLTAGEELILSAGQKGKSSGEFKQLFVKAREKLLLWGIKPYQIDNWVKAGSVPRIVTLFANESGVVRKRTAVPGKYFKEGQNYFELSDLSQVWVEMEVYEQDSNLVKLGQKASLRFVAKPGVVEIGEIDFVSPTIDEGSRTLKVRATILNSNGYLKPGMVAQGIISVQFDGVPLVVPAPAVIDTGLRKIVWVQGTKNRYFAKKVETGFLSEGYTEVVSGLRENEKVVLDGNFLLDAQAQFFGGYEDFEKSSSDKARAK